MIFSEGLITVKMNGKWGGIDTKGNWAIQPIFENANSFNLFGKACDMQDEDGCRNYAKLKK